MKRNEVRRGSPALLRVGRKSVWVWPQYRSDVAGFAGSHRNVDGTHQDLWAVEDEHGTWRKATPRQLRRTDTQQSQDTLIAARKAGK